MPFGWAFQRHFDGAILYIPSKIKQEQFDCRLLLSLKHVINRPSTLDCDTVIKYKENNGSSTTKTHRITGEMVGLNFERIIQNIYQSMWFHAVEIPCNMNHSFCDIRVDLAHKFSCCLITHNFFDNRQALLFMHIKLGISSSTYFSFLFFLLFSLFAHS